MLVSNAKTRSSVIPATCSVPTLVLCVLVVALTFFVGFLSTPQLVLHFRAANIRVNILNQIWGNLNLDPSANFSAPTRGQTLEWVEGVAGTNNVDLSPRSVHVPSTIYGNVPLVLDSFPSPFSSSIAKSQRRIDNVSNGDESRNISKDETGEINMVSDGEARSRLASSNPIKDVLSSTPARTESNRPPDDKTKHVSESSVGNPDANRTDSAVDGHADQCNLFKGSWVPDPLGPLYRNNSCPVLSQPQNCQSNGRPDSDYENWRWQPTDCKLSRFDAQTFLRIMQGKTLAFVGDSVARNQMESLMCILWQVETPRNIGNRKMQRWHFRSHSVTIIRIWSAWLVHTSTAGFQFAPGNLTKLYLEEPDESFMDYLPKFNVLVLSTGHWFTKKAAYILNSEVVGGQLWWNKNYPLKVKNTDAFPITIRTALKAIVSNPEYKGLTIFRTYSPDHYEGGGWNTGGSCTGKAQPLTDTEVAFNAYTELMRKHQLKAFKEIERDIGNASKLRLMDITPVFSYRADGHPGPFRNRDPNKATKRGPKGQPPPQDCLHWCMPGPIDTWNEFLLEILRQELTELS